MHFQYNFSGFSFKANLKIECHSMLLLVLRWVSTCGAVIQNFTTSAGSVNGSMSKTVLMRWSTTGRVWGYFIQGFGGVVLTMAMLRVRSPRLSSKEQSKVHCHGKRPFGPWPPKPASLLLLLVLLPSPPFSWLHGLLFLLFSSLLSLMLFLPPYTTCHSRFLIALP